MEEYVEAAKFAAAALLAKGPLTKLIEVGQAAVGTWYKPRAMRNEADAKAYELETMAYAQAKADIIKSNAEIEMADRARQRLYQQEMQRQRNIENILDETENQLNETVSDTPVDEEWRTRFFNKAQDISSKDLQAVWAKILAGEITQPGGVSLRTLDVLNNLSKEEAQIFEKVSDLATFHGAVYKISEFRNDLTKFGVTFGDIQLLRSAGLMEGSDNAAVRFDEVDFIKLEEFYVVDLHYGNHRLLVGKKDDHPFELLNFNLNQSGKELLRVISHKSNEIYLKAFSDSLATQGFSTRIEILNP
ncbi:MULTISPECIES: DUF2806 domain-containing protein [unclassified Mucilaginibacter]|uniref:DUF2806 domain-containing protein n=1 Tax=unclassified Mucilaginibacter TaxID=2617802 RepID=UPI002AC9ED0B|nr:MULTISPECIES: DUF2806 domain-containing protein [unclassified Mucilaginibacter]MEB0262095.1 DUF2806 domain-containing protein [Mucilaginibacter sp. 10I4]MEB0278795.1 DUF2806 domain-containing protein [Mucilaginibacter sp. 10B2]MEB0299840.1 DUF2806 domain-containing protein [Mucilaginibacter sp. 5C4]WPX21978.1 DUF2806 domain-containing protein [Mucilaginibacter sp. 5C4]